MDGIRYCDSLVEIPKRQHVSIIMILTCFVIMNSDETVSLIKTVIHSIKMSLFSFVVINYET